MNFIIHFYLYKLHFKESGDLIGCNHFGPYLKDQNFSRYGIGGEISVTILVFNLDYFQKKLLRKFFRKCKKSYFGAILSPFSLNLGKNEFFWEKRALLVFKYSNYLPSCKNLKKLMKRRIKHFPKIPLHKRISESPY